MKKSTIVIISIAAAVFVLGILTALSIFAVKRLAPLVEKELQQQEQPKGKAEDVNAETLKKLASKHGATYWADSLKTNYSYELLERTKGLAGKTIVLKANLNDIVPDGSSYTAIFMDSDITGAPYSIMYRLKCTGSQVAALIKPRSELPKEGYVFFIVAADVDRIVERKINEEDIWGPPLTIYGSLLESVKAELEEDEYDY